MQSPDEFCQKIDSKLRLSIIISLAAVFAAACVASLLIYFFAPVDVFSMGSFPYEENSRGKNGCFLMTMAQSDGTEEFSVVSSELSDGVFSAVILGKNLGNEDIILKPADFCVYATDVQNGGKSKICCVKMTENVVISSGSNEELTISAYLPEGLHYDGCKMSAFISVGGRGESIGLMLN